MLLKYMARWAIDLFFATQLVFAYPLLVSMAGYLSSAEITTIMLSVILIDWGAKGLVDWIDRRLADKRSIAYAYKKQNAAR